MIPQELENLLSQDGFIVFVEGKKGSGKTNFSMLLLEICHNFNLRTNFATNIETKCDYIKKIDNYYKLESWLQNDSGKKLYVLDEAGKHIKKMRFMTDQNLKFMELLQLIRHYDAGFIGVAPSSSFIDSSFLNTDILDARVRKLNKSTVKVVDYLSNSVYLIHRVPKTSIRHNGKDIALFNMNKEKIEMSSLPQERKAYLLYAELGNYKQVGEQMSPKLTADGARDLVLQEMRKAS